ncbi:hypothetical protein [Algisphaera agarilytica]|uniref:Tetratricopeptide repeat-containing protein n=1 Tax=Algisphaera agarilytica TaxID=1385975 RepID=A0A7X0HA04_9BACT|nr:hypothetical protein [Algisphaera agarilytica]MBB6430570.1 hypothetical protein [Algisphaera agarilytica]
MKAWMTRRGAAMLCGLLLVLASPGAYAQAGPSLADPAVQKFLTYLESTGEFDGTASTVLKQIDTLRAAARDSKLSGQERLTQFNEARKLLRGLIDNPEMEKHPLRPVWRTELAEMLLVTHLQGFRRSAPGFVEFGVPTANQRKAFEQDVPIALAMLIQASQEFRDLEARLDRDTALREQIETSLLNSLVFDQYRDQKNAWFAANAAYFATLLGDEHSFFLGGNMTADKKRAEMRGVAMSMLRPFLDGDIGGDALQARAQSLAGRVLLSGGEADRAEAEYLAPAVANPAWNSDRLAASIARASAIEQQGKPDVAEVRLAELSKRSAVRERLDDRLLVADALHLLRLRKAEQAQDAERDALITQAYAAYFELLNDPALGNGASALRNLIYDRWASSIPAEADAQTIQSLPGAVRVAVADISRRRGLLWLQRGEEEAGRTSLQRAIDFAQTVDDRDAVGDEVWADGRYNLAYATYALNPKKLSSLLSAAEVSTSVAEQTPTLPVATDAIDLATRLLESLHRNYADQPGVTPAFERAMGVLYDSGHFDTTKPADDRLVYYAYAMFQSRGDYEQAAELYNQQLRTHPNYLQAQAQRVSALTQWYEQTREGSKRNRIESDLLDAARRVSAQARPVLADPAQSAKADGAARTLANAKLAEAQVLATRGDLDGALESIAGFESEFADRPGLAQLGLERRILLLVEADRLDQAQEAAGTMMGRYPDAAAGVINNVLNDMERQIEQLGDESPDSAKLAEAAAAMAKLLADWAQGQGYEARQMLPYRLVVLKSLRIANRPDEALAYLRDTNLEAEFGNNVDVLFEKARALVSKGDPASLREATPILNRIIGGLTEPYPDTYWRSWIARLEVNLKLGERVADVPRRVRQLEQTHPELGGEPFKSQLKELAIEAQRRGL